MLFTRVESFDDIPDGIWLVELESNIHGSNVHLLNKEDCIGVVAGRFHFDTPAIVGYAPVPEVEYE